MKVYISGRIKDNPTYVADFDRGVEEVIRLGHQPLSPLDIDCPTEEYHDYLKYDLIAMLTECDTIYMLDGWEKSVGARLEHQVACLCGLSVTYEYAGQWLRDKNL